MALLWANIIYLPWGRSPAPSGCGWLPQASSILSSEIPLDHPKPLALGEWTHSTLLILGNAENGVTTDPVSP